MTDRYGDWMQTFSGIQFWPLDPRSSEVQASDIGHALANICRYNGHTRNFYSVAEHSILVSEVIEPEHALWGLLHDAPEAYLGDMIRPIKRFIPQYKAREERVMDCIAAYFNLGPEPVEAIKRADNAVLAAEGSIVFRHNMRHLWKLDERPADVIIDFMNPIFAYASFMARLQELLAARHRKEPL